MFPAELRGGSNRICWRGAEQALRDQDQPGGGEGQRGVEVSLLHHRRHPPHDQKDKRVGNELTELKAALLLFSEEPLIKSCPTSEHF